MLCLGITLHHVYRYLLLIVILQSSISVGNGEDMPINNPQINNDAAEVVGVAPKDEEQPAQDVQGDKAQRLIFNKDLAADARSVTAKKIDDSPDSGDEADSKPVNVFRFLKFITCSLLLSHYFRLVINSEIN